MFIRYIKYIISMKIVFFTVCISLMPINVSPVMQKMLVGMDSGYL